MKKTLLALSIFLMFASSNVFGAITVTLTTSAITRSTTYPAYYDVKLQLKCQDNSLCNAGLFTFSVERKLTTDTNWSLITLNMPFPADTTPDGAYLNYGYALQLPGKQYMYKVKVSYSGNGCSATPTYTGYVTCQGAKPDFTLGTTGITFSDLDGPITLCKSSQLYFNPGSCELETKYYVGITPCNRWWDVGDNVGNGQWYLTQAPNQNKAMTEVNGGPLLGGVFDSGTLIGQDRYYRITVATGEPVWFTKSVLIRVDEGCRVAVVDVRDSEEIPVESLIKIYPNPVKDNLIINLENNKLIKKVSFFDMNNNLAKEEQYKGADNNAVINIGALKKGLYLIAIETTDGIVRSKVVKE
ncbi:T9SS type A sorting domain-containing protein [Flavobacterium humi]|uniref:T9SS type A sorting domain-containing protein n=1 Tax=Flavobacterium humi TaxID=2562683 RepID=A0A4Z0LCR5_9FLAO|nr:T9SS type A sorting domain-containing protein [Flavobacterium humi]TGD59655.1 T9SS type A sorting domain-containing protein [Flavobacterium humi]